VGVNVGLFSLASSAWGFRALGFEPIPANHNCTRQAYCANPSLQSRVTLVPAAVGNETCTDPGVTIYAVEGREDNTAMSKVVATANVEGRIANITVPIVAIDDYIASQSASDPKDCVWMKIDVQGYESHGANVLHPLPCV
jgi:FkbM family methyltransferase